MRQSASDTVGRLYQGQAAATALFLGGARGGSVPPAPRVTEFRKVGCLTAQPRAGHLCDFELALNGIARGTNRGRFFTAPGGALEMSLTPRAAAREGTAERNRCPLLTRTTRDVETMI